MSDQVSISEQKTILPEEDREIVPEKAVEKEKIAIANDVLRKLEWIPLKNLPNIALTGRRFWLFGDENFEGRKHKILSMNVKADPDQLEVERVLDGCQVVPFAEVEPPAGFSLTNVECSYFNRMNKKIGEKALKFLRVSKPLFLHAVLNVNWDSSDVNSLDNFLEVFDNCMRIKITGADSTLAEQFFAKEAISNCNSLSFSEMHNFDPNSAFNWLHSSSSTTGSIAKRQIDLDKATRRIANDYIAFISRLKKKFLEDDVKQKFVVRFYRHDLLEIANIQEGNLQILMAENIQKEENLQTGEVMFMRDDGNYRDLVRCAKGEKETVAYEPIIIDHPYIQIY